MSSSKSRVTTKSRIEQQLCLVFAVKEQLDLVYRQRNYFRGACRSVDRLNRAVREIMREDQGQQREIDGQLLCEFLKFKFVKFQVSRKTIRKLDRKLLNLNLYNQLVELYESLMIANENKQSNLTQFELPVKNNEFSRSMSQSTATKSQVEKQLGLVFAMKKQLDLVYMQLNYFRDACRNVNRFRAARKRLLDGHSQLDPSRLHTKFVEFERNYRYWRKRICKLDRQLLEINLYDKLYDLFDSLVIGKSIAAAKELIGLYATKDGCLNTRTSKISNFSPTKLSTNTPQPSSVSGGNGQVTTQSEEVSVVQTQQQQRQMTISDVVPVPSAPQQFLTYPTMGGAPPNSFNSIPMVTGPLLSLVSSPNMTVCPIPLNFVPMTPAPQCFLIYAPMGDPITLPPDLIYPQAKPRKRKLKRDSFIINNGPNADKPFNCDQFEQRFQTFYKLYKHQRNTHEPKRFVYGLEGCDNANIRPITPENDSLSAPEKTTSNQDSNSGNLKSKTIVNYCNWEGCNFSTESKEHLKVHESNHTGELAYKCDVEGCSFTTHTSQFLNTHKFTHTNERPFQCDQCKQRFQTVFKLNFHQKNTHEPKRFVCCFEGCDYADNNGGNLRRHFKSKHPKQTVQANKISKKKLPEVTPENDSLSGSKKTNSNQDSNSENSKSKTVVNYCNWEGCNFSTGSKKNLKAHESIHTGERVYKCDVKGCSFTTHKPQILSAHKFTHANERPFQCDQCDKSFKSTLSLKQHMLVHNVEPRFRCSVEGCDYGTQYSQCLKMHEMKVHIGERTFKCSECDKSYFYAASLNQHKRTHVSQFKCSFDGCDFISHHSTSIKIHEMRVHIGSPQFKCDWEGCNYAAYETTELKYHRAIHTGESLYKCNWEGCQRTFRKQRQLFHHKQNHANPNAFRYRCKVEGCDFGNNSVAQMTKHLKIEHKDHKNLMIYLFEYPVKEFKVPSKFGLLNHYTNVQM